MTSPQAQQPELRQVAQHYPLAGLLFCGVCNRQLVSNPLRGVPSFICSPTGRGGCGKIRIQSDFVERFLIERIREQDVAALEEPGQARIRVALRQLQDDHYDGLLDRADFLRQSQRLRAALASRRDGEPLRRVTDADRRLVLRRALERVVVHPHPVGQPSSHLNWARPSRQRGLSNLPG